MSLKSFYGLIGGGGEKYPVYISYMDFCKNFIQDGTGLNTERAVTKVSDTSLTVTDTTRLAVDTPVVIKTVNNNYIFNIVESVVSTTIALKTTITEDFATIQDILAANTDALHLSENAYKANGQYIANLKTQNVLLKDNLLDGNIQNGKLNVASDPKVYKISDNSVMLNFQYLPGSGYNTPAASYGLFQDETYYLLQSDQLGFGISLNVGSVDSGGLVIITAYSRIYSTYYGEFLIELVNSSNQIVSNALINRSTYYKNTFFNIPATDTYTIRFKSNSTSTPNYNRLSISNIQVFNKTGMSSSSLFNTTSKIAIFGDSWTQRIAGAPSKLRPDGSTLNGLGTLGEGIKSILPNAEILYCGLAGSTSEWGRYWVDYVIGLRPTHVVLNFGINDYNSRNNYPATSSVYDFDQDNKWAFKTLAAGGTMGSTSKARYIENMQYIINKFIDNRITPIVLIDPPIAGFLTNGRLWTSNLLNGKYE